MIFDSTQITDSADDVFDLIGRLWDSHDTPVQENRASDRRPISLPVFVQPVNDHLQPVGEPFTAISRNISLGGIGFIASCPVETRLAQIRCQGLFADQSLLIEIRHQNPVGDFYLIGGTFLVDAHTEFEPVVLM